jgi:hypothetical protein
MIYMENEASHVFIPSRLGDFSANARTCITFGEFCGKIGGFSANARTWWRRKRRKA